MVKTTIGSVRPVRARNLAKCGARGAICAHNSSRSAPLAGARATRPARAAAGRQARARRSRPAAPAGGRRCPIPGRRPARSRSPPRSPHAGGRPAAPGGHIGHAALLAAVDLHVGGVQVDRHRPAGQRRRPLRRQQPQHPLRDRCQAGLHRPPLIGGDPPGQARSRRRGQSRYRGELLPRGIGALAVQPHQEVLPGQLRRSDPGQQLPGAKAPVPRLTSPAAASIAPITPSRPHSYPRAECQFCATLLTWLRRSTRRYKEPDARRLAARKHPENMPTGLGRAAAIAQALTGGAWPWPELVAGLDVRASPWCTEAAAPPNAGQGRIMVAAFAPATARRDRPGGSDHDRAGLARWPARPGSRTRSDPSGWA